MATSFFRNGIREKSPPPASTSDVISLSLCVCVRACVRACVRVCEKQNQRERERERDLRSSSRRQRSLSSCPSRVKPAPTSSPLSSLRLAASWPSSCTGSRSSSWKQTEKVRQTDRERRRGRGGASRLRRRANEGLTAWSSKRQRRFRGLQSPVTSGGPRTGACATATTYPNPQVQL